MLEVMERHWHTFARLAQVELDENNAEEFQGSHDSITHENALGSQSDDELIGEGHEEEELS